MGIEVEQRCIREGETWRPAAQVLRVKFSDRLRILELAGKHAMVGAFKPEVEKRGEILIRWLRDEDE